MTRGAASKLALCSALALPCGAARADPHSFLRPATARAAEAAHLAQGLEARALGLEGVTKAHVEVTLPDPLARPLDAPAEPPTVRFSLRARHATWPHLEPALRHSAESALAAQPRAPRIAFTWQRPAQPPRAPLVPVGPFRIAPESAGALRAALLVLLATSLSLSALLLRYTRRQLRDGPPNGDGTRDRTGR